MRNLGGISDDKALASPPPGRAMERVWPTPSRAPVRARSDTRRTDICVSSRRRKALPRWQVVRHGFARLALLSR